MRNLRKELGLDPGIQAVIVSRHLATVEWLRDVFHDLKEATVLTGNVSKEQLMGKLVVGNLPMNLATYPEQYVAVEFQGDPPRGKEYDRVEMENAGIYVQPYVVFRGTRKAMVTNLVSNGYSGIIPDEF